MNDIEKLQSEVERLKTWNKWFFGRVSYMRECQKDYFKTRSIDALHKSKALEQEVDAEIKRINELQLRKSDLVQQLILEFDCEIKKQNNDE